MSREELRRQQQTTSSAQQGHHFGMIFLGTIVAVIAAICLFLNLTVLNSDFAADELADSAVSTQIQSQVNDSVSQYGFSGKILTLSETKGLVRQAVKQVYAGKEINLDLSQVEKRWENQINAGLNTFGLSTSLVPSTITDSLKSQVSTEVNENLNTSEVKTASRDIYTAKTIVNLLLGISSLILLIMAIWSLLRRYFVQSFSWIVTWTTLLMILVMAVLRPGLLKLASSYPDYASTIVQVTSAVIERGWQIIAVMVIVGIALWIVRVLKHRSG